MIKYSIETDLIYDTAIHKGIPNDAVKISLTEKHEHMGNIIHDGKRRVKHTYPFVFEDIPPKSTDELFTEEMNAINDRYKSGTKAAIEKVSSAIGWDGATESTKVANARAELYQLKENYDTQSLAIINKYYGA